MGKKLLTSTNEDKNYIILYNFYDFNQTYPQQNDIIRRYTEQVILFILFLATETDHILTRSENCYHFLIYNFFMQIMRSEPRNFAKLTLYDVSVTSGWGTWYHYEGEVPQCLVKIQDGLGRKLF